MKINLTEKQLDAVLEAIDFWQGSLVGIDEYAAEYKKACKIDEVIRDKRSQARAKVAK
jgi:hypothetical protein